MRIPSKNSNDVFYLCQIMPGHPPQRMININHSFLLCQLDNVALIIWPAWPLASNSFLGPRNNGLASTVCSIKANPLLAGMCRWPYIKLPSSSQRRRVGPPTPQAQSTGDLDVSGFHTRFWFQNNCNSSWKFSGPLPLLTFNLSLNSNPIF